MADRTISEEHAVRAVGWIAAELTSLSRASWPGTPSWLPEPPEWVDLWERALTLTRPKGLPAEYLESIVDSKDQELAHRVATREHVTIGWAICDGALVIYDVDDPPEWFRFDRDDDGNSVQR